MKPKVKRKLGDVALKLDISETYYMIDLTYLRGAILKMSLSHQ